MNKIKEIINSEWVNSVAAGLIAIGFGVYGHWFVAGIATGYGLKTLFNIFKIPEVTEKCLCDCDTCNDCEK